MEEELIPVSKVAVFNKMVQLAQQENKHEDTPQELARKELLDIIKATLNQEKEEKTYYEHISMTQDQIQRLLS
jgi:hypothetical protein